MVFVHWPLCNSDRHDCPSTPISVVIEDRDFLFKLIEINMYCLTRSTDWQGSPVERALYCSVNQKAASSNPLKIIEILVDFVSSWIKTLNWRSRLRTEDAGHEHHR